MASICITELSPAVKFRSWHEISSGELLWGQIDIEFSQSDKKSQKLFRAALRRAPTLRTIDLSDNYSGLSENGGVWRALKNGVTDVRGLIGLRERTTDKNYILKLLVKYGPHLRRLALTLGPGASDYVAKLSSGATVRVFSLISQMPQLRRLVISDETLRMDMYSGDFRQGLPQLRHVGFCGFPEQPWTSDQENVMILDILKNRKEFLKTIDLVWTNHGEEVNSMFPDVAALMKQLESTLGPVIRNVCPKLRTFTVGEFNSSDSIVMKT
ncbi:uncharacterized protein LOC113215457 [Frankliniella occidentalis]|uniref:Uncharacterized protein LOC113215457 n=1 Tax=Frankliniella occidentalis TaxID=133901 RepID=A0A9C6U9I7_FRAOC|nr:uncharacterized protein LOC113215457 [Frankliniella occidentalis]